MNETRDTATTVDVVTAIAAAAPPLSEAQRSRLAALLRPAKAAAR